NVTKLVRQGGRVSLALTAPSPSGLSLRSRESAETSPRLVVKTGPLDLQPSFPIRAAFYYPWFPEAWTQHGIYPYTRYNPSLGFYNSSVEAVIRRHVQALEYGKLDVGIVSWWGKGSRSDIRVPLILRATPGVSSTFRWTLYYEPEGSRNPSLSKVASDLRYIRRRYGHDPSYLRIRGRPVVVVYNANDTNCDVAKKWRAANAAVNAYIVLKVFPGYKACASQPASWHQYSPAVAADSQSGYSYAISPGFWLADAAERLVRDPARWNQNVRDMVASNAPWQLVTTFNEWGEGTSVESASEWQSGSGFGTYLDALHNDGGGPPPPLPPPPPGPDFVLVGAGDIARCASSGDEATAALLDAIPGIVYTTGDNAYESGTAAEFANCYHPNWGRHKVRTRPSVGNHEYLTAGAAGYYGYFGQAAGDPTRGYYSYDLGEWHIVVLNAECSRVGGCNANSPQEQWLRTDLATHPAACTLAYWHQPRFSSGQYSNDPAYVPFWQALYNANAELVLNGHDHNYQRYAPQTPAGARNNLRGIREIVVGTGGRNYYPVDPGPVPNREVANGTTFGVLKLTLHPTSYDWQFVPVPGGTFSDSGSTACH
ncbi:MAG: metallophosphoesterase, partial [Actinomycetota bacterium]